MPPPRRRVLQQIRGASFDHLVGACERRRCGRQHANTPHHTSPVVKRRHRSTGLENYFDSAEFAHRA
jgi:hypothetical protein